MEPRSEQYVIGEDYVVRAPEEFGFAPRKGYSFARWVDLSGTAYLPGQTVRILGREFALSAVWEPSARSATVIRLKDASSVDIFHAATAGGKISVDVGEG